MDVLEFYTSSMHLSSAFANATVKVGQPVDLRQDFDLANQYGQSQSWSRLTTQSPAVLLLLPFGQTPASHVSVRAGKKGLTKKGLKDLVDKVDSEARQGTDLRSSACFLPPRCLVSVGTWPQLRLDHGYRESSVESPRSGSSKQTSLVDPNSPLCL